MEATTRPERLSTLLLSGTGLIRKAVIWVMIFAMVQTLCLPMVSHAEMAQPQISDSVGIGLLAGFVILLVAVGLLSTKTEAAPETQEQKAGNIITLTPETAPSPCPAGTVAIVSWQ